MSRSPGFTSAAVVTIALGIGINTGIFSVLNGLVLRDLPVPAGERLVTIYQMFEGPREMHGSHSMFSTPEYRTYRDGATRLSGLTAYAGIPWTVTLGSETPRELRASGVMCNYFDVLRRRAALGTGFTAANCNEYSADPVVVLSNTAWKASFAADPAIVGRSVLLNGQSFVVVGVAPEGFDGVDFEKVELFVPAATQPLLQPGRDFHEADGVSWLTLLGRLSDGATLGEARAELGAIAARIDQEQGRSTRLLVERAQALSAPQPRTAALAVGGIVMTTFGLVLLLACANVANLLLARASGRSREMAVRLSLGANRGRLIQQLLIESGLIALAGGVLGSVLALWSFRSLLALVLSALPDRISALRIDPSPDQRVLVFAGVLTFVTGILFGLLPALRATRPDLHSVLKDDSSGTPGRSGRHLQGSLVGVQVAICIVLTIASGLLLRGLYVAQTVDPGFHYRDVAVVSFDLRGFGYDALRAGLFQRRLIESAAALPGVEDIAQAAVTPLSSEDSWQTAVQLPGEDQWRQIAMNVVSPSFASLVGIPIMRGRSFSEADLDDASTAAIVTETTARRLWPGVDPLGRSLVMRRGPHQTTTLEIVGVAKDANLSSIGQIDDGYVYLPASPGAQPALKLLVKSHGDFAALAKGLRAAAAEIDPALAVRVQPLEANLDFWRSLARVVAALATSLGTLALTLASVGVYSVVAYAVSRRLREIGIRMALGAGERRVLWLIVRQTMRPVAIGAVIGLAISFAVSRALSSVLFGVSALDPIAMLGATAVVLGIALSAGALPVRRATRVDPIATLRYE